jgi:hypothetical protein
MDETDNSGDVIASLVRALLDTMTTQQANDPDVGDPPAAERSSGWHNMMPPGLDEPVVAPWQSWIGLRAIAVLHAKGLILVVFEEQDEADENVYLYVEPLAGYAGLGMDDRQVAGLITMHLEELLGGVGWQQNVPALRLGRLVLLKPGTLFDAV